MNRARKDIGTYRYFKRHDPLNCPDCGEETIIRGGSLLGELPYQQVVPVNVMYQVYGDIFGAQSFRSMCTVCQDVTEALVLWIRIDEDRLIGPLCGLHFYFYTTQLARAGGMARDQYVYYLYVSNRMQRRLDDLRDHVLRFATPKTAADRQAQPS